MRKRRFLNRQLIILLSGIFIILYVVIQLNLNNISFLHTIYTPFGNSFSYFREVLVSPLVYFENKVSLLQENKVLKKKIDEYQILLSNYEELNQENKRLKKLLNFKDIKDYKRISTYVIGKSPDIWHKEIVINAGKNELISENDPVVSSWGLVGRVKSVTENSANVSLIIDNANWVSTVNSRSRDIGMLKYDDKKAKLAFLVARPDYQENDLLFSSGLGGVYPKGIPVAVVSKVIKKEGSNIPDVEAELLTNFNKLEEVSVLIRNEQ